MIAGTSGSDTKLCQPCSSQSKITQTRSPSEGSWKTIAPFDPCCLRFSAPFVEKTSMKRSKSSTCVVASSTVPSPSGGFAGWSGGDGRSADEAFLRVDRLEALDDLEPAAARLRDVHVHAQVVLTRDHGRGPARSFGDLGVVEGGDDVVLAQGAGLRDRRGPEA